MSDEERCAVPSWADEWLSGVADGTYTMSRRKRAVVDRHGGLDAARAAAGRLGVHLLVLTDDEGVELVTASRSPFTVAG